MVMAGRVVVRKTSAQSSSRSIRVLHRAETRALRSTGLDNCASMPRS
jgi:hypothetical protein